MMVVDRHRYGVVAIIGRPNVGKSTLLNRLVGEKISITSRKPQTTRHSIRGILTLEDAQFVFVDTPGYQREHRGALNAAMNRNITRSLADIDAVVLVIGPDKPQPADITMLDRVPPKVPVILAINMIDKIDSRRVFEILGEIGVSEKYSDVVPISAKQGKNVDELLNVLKERLPFGEAAFPADELTDRDERFLAAERIREKLFRNLGDEVPYGACVVIEKFTLENGVRRIHAAIIVDREGHKPIIIGARGDKLKTVGSAARLELERLFHGKVYLELWVKVRRGWTDNESLVDNYGHV